MPLLSTPSRAPAASVARDATDFIKRKLCAFKALLRSVKWSKAIRDLLSWVRDHRYEFAFSITSPMGSSFIIKRLLEQAGISVERLFKDAETWVKQHPWYAGLVFVCAAGLCVPIAMVSPSLMIGSLAVNGLVASVLLGLALYAHFTSADINGAARYHTL